MVWRKTREGHGRPSWHNGCCTRNLSYGWNPSSRVNSDQSFQMANRTDIYPCPVIEVQDGIESPHIRQFL